MNREEILNAINETIRPNEEKAITAQSLNNLLTEMALSSGSGSGDGALRIISPSPENLDMFIEMGGFTEENWDIAMEEALLELEEIKNDPDEGMYYDMYVDMFIRMDTIFRNAFVHNAEVFNVLVEKTENEEAAFAILDYGESGAILLEQMLNALGQIGGMETNIRLKVSQGTICEAAGLIIYDKDGNLSTDSSILGEGVGPYVVGIRSLTPLKGVLSDEFGIIEMTLTPEGGLVDIFYVNEEEEEVEVELSEVVIYFPGDYGEGISDYSKEHNLDIKSKKYYLLIGNPVYRYYRTSDTGSIGHGNSGVITHVEDINEIREIYYIHGIEYRKCTIDTDGLATDELLGTIINNS